VTTSSAPEIPRRAVVRLVRFGFLDGERAARLLSEPEMGLWDLERNEPADPEAGPVVSALARTGDPDLAVRSLRRLIEALDAADPSGGSAAALLARLRGSALLRSRLLGVLGASSGLADHLAAHPGDWTVLDGDGDGRGPTRPTPQALERQMLVAVGADPDDPPWGVRLGSGAPDADPQRVADLRLAYRRAILSVAGRDLGEGLAAEDVAAELADIAAAVLAAGLAVAVAEQPADAAACRLAVIALGKTGGRELNYVSDVDVVFVAEPVDPSDPEAPAVQSATRVAAALMRHLRGGGPGRSTPRCARRGRPARWCARCPVTPPTTGSGPSTWEFQALLKMRPVAGDPDLGRAYVEELFRWCGRPASVPASSPRCRPCGGGSRRPSRPRRPTGSSSSAAAACATSSSPSSCCSWCTVGSTSGCTSAAPCRRCPRCAPAATWAATTPTR
jgi:glutamate-ammonia-ligase adenylyltransferase